jgi:CRISPR/Cas system CMR subunit Cmr4 (Cas7 group RAMP superfamily)
MVKQKIREKTKGKDKLADELSKQAEIIKTKEGHILLLNDALKSKEEEIMLLKANLELKDDKNKEQLVSMKSTLKEDKSENQEMRQLKEILMKQNNKIKEFRASIVYPLYLVTHNIGKTKVGNKIEAMIKGKRGNKK